MTTTDVIYSVEGLVYVVVLVAILLAVRGIRRELKRIADRLYWPLDEEPPAEE